jgi:tRNA (Thr-GGU) A37 N-methylase
MDEADGQLRLTPIGVVRSVYNLCVGTPRQGLLAPQARGRIDLTGSLLANGEDAVQGLDEYSHIWIVFCFHLNTLPKDSHKIPSKIAPPALGGRKIGVLASRSPHRPNPVGMTLAKLDRITTTQRYLHDDGASRNNNNNNNNNGKPARVTSLYISGLDLVDGTPVLDIKPYVPVYDAVPDCVLPAWVTDGLQMERPVQWTATARENLWQILTDDPTALRFYGSDESSGGGGGSRRIGEQVDDTIADVTACIEQVLARDVRSRWQTKKTRKGAFQAERSHRIDTATVVEDSSSANVVDSLQPQVSSSMLKKECTQQLDRLLIHYNVKEKAQQRRPESQGSGAEDEVTITTVTLLPVASTVESQEVA